MGLIPKWVRGRFQGQNLRLVSKLLKETAIKNPETPYAVWLDRNKDLKL